MSEVIAYVGLGSNLADPLWQLQKALERLALLPATSLMAQSSLYLTPPMGPQNQPDYINAAVSLRTLLSAEALLEALRGIEALHERQRQLHWGPRTLDLDLLLYGQAVICTERLQVPHPGLCQRIFVVQPLMEIAPQLVLPDGRALAGVLEQLVAAGDSIQVI